MTSRRHKHPTRSLGIAALALTLLLAACGGDPDSVEGADSNKEETTRFEPLRIGYLPNYWQSLIGLADEKGFFEDAGLEVTTRVIDQGPAAVEALAAGELDISAVGDVPPLVGTAAGAVDVHYYRTFDITPLYTILALESIQSVEDLAGKDVIVSLGTMMEFWYSLALEKHGLSLEDVNPIDAPIPDVGVTFAGGNGVAAAPNPNEMPAILAKTDSHILFSGAELNVGPNSPNVTLFDGIMVSRDFAERHPETVSRFWEVWFDVVVPYYNDDKTHDQAATELAEWQRSNFGAEISPELFDFLKDGTVIPTCAEIKRDLGEARASMGEIGEFMVQKGVFDAPPSLDALLTTDYLPC